MFDRGLFRGGIVYFKDYVYVFGIIGSFII